MLGDLVKSFDLVDIWQNLRPVSIAFMFVSPGVGASRINLLYTSQAYTSRVPVASIQQVPCTDHHLHGSQNLHQGIGFSPGVCDGPHDPPRPVIHGPGDWRIHNNIHFVRERIHFCQRTGLLSTFLSLDQEKACRHDLINAWDMVDPHRAYAPSGVAAIVREPLFRNLHLHNRDFEWLSEGRAVAVGVTSVRDVLGGGGLGWMLPQELAHRVVVGDQFKAIQHLKTAVLRPDVVPQVEDAQVCDGNPPRHLIFGRPVQRGVGRSEDLLMALLLGLARLAVNRSRQQAMEGLISTDCLPLFCTASIFCSSSGSGESEDQGAAG
eukprot:g36279.t1